MTDCRLRLSFSTFVVPVRLCSLSGKLHRWHGLCLLQVWWGLGKGEGSIRHLFSRHSSAGFTRGTEICDVGQGIEDILRASGLVEVSGAVPDGVSPSSHQDCHHVMADHYRGELATGENFVLCVRPRTPYLVCPDIVCVPKIHLSAAHALTKSHGSTRSGI